jgi:cytochrome c553
MRALKLVLPTVVLTAGFLVCTTATYGKPEYAKAEKKGCTFCHGKMVTDKAEMAKNLNDAGTYYKTHDHKLEGYTPKK